MLNSGMNSMPISKPHFQRARTYKRVLVANCFFEDSRQSIPRTTQVPQAMGATFLAGAFSARVCDVRVYNEHHSGPLENEQLLSWPDMLVLTGLTTAFDRMLHLTAYARTKNPHVIVVAGGPPIRALPHYSRRFFDYCCRGDIEQMKEVIADAFGEAYVAREILPRYDLAYWLRSIGYVESSRNCNFQCHFCTLTGEGGAYQKYDLEYIRKQILVMGKREHLAFIDNNFYGNDKKFFLARLELIKDLWKAGLFRGWSALVTNDFFYKDENLQLARDAGCVALFSGVESFDTEWLRKNKTQNTRFPQVQLIRKCLDAGIVFLYGLIMDVTTRRIADLRRELDFITGTPDITLPSYLSAPIPILGTPFFNKCLAKGDILPETKVRDLDSSTLSLRPLDPIGQVADFIRDIQSLRRDRYRVLQHSLGFFLRYRSKLTKTQMMTALSNARLLCAFTLSTSGWLGGLHKPTRQRTHISTTETLDEVYKPAFRVASCYEDYFKPTMVTDKAGHLSEDLAEDLLVTQEA